MMVRLTETDTQINNFAVDGPLMVVLHTRGLLVSRDFGKWLPSSFKDNFLMELWDKNYIHVNAQDNRIAIGFGNALYVSNDGGQKFTRAVFPHRVALPISNVVSDGRHVFATFGSSQFGTDKNTIMISHDGGLNFIESVPFGSVYTSHEELAIYRGLLFVMSRDGNFVSTDFGESFLGLHREIEEWTKFITHAASIDTLVKDRFEQFVLPSFCMYSQTNRFARSYVLAYDNKNFLTSDRAEAKGIIYEFGDDKTQIYAENAPRAVRYDEKTKRFFYTTFTTVFVLDDNK